MADQGTTSPGRAGESAASLAVSMRSDRWLALTPTLSPRRGNQRSSRGKESLDCEGFPSLGKFLPAHEPQNCPLDYEELAHFEVQGHKARTCSGSSLPGGEGQGEGERDCQLHGFASVAGRRRTLRGVRRLIRCAPWVFGLVFAIAAIAAGSNPDWSGVIPVSPGGWGRMAQLGADEWLCVSTLFPASQPTQLGLYRTTNRCASWSAVGVVSAPGRKLDNGNLLHLPDGTLLLTGRSLIDEQSYRLPVYRSADRGLTWAQIGNIDANEAAPGGVPRTEFRESGRCQSRLAARAGAARPFGYKLGPALAAGHLPRVGPFGGMDSLARNRGW